MFIEKLPASVNLEEKNNSSSLVNDSKKDCHRICMRLEAQNQMKLRLESQVMTVLAWMSFQRGTESFRVS